MVFGFDCVAVIVVIVQTDGAVGAAVTVVIGGDNIAAAVVVMCDRAVRWRVMHDGRGYVQLAEPVGRLQRFVRNYFERRKGRRSLFR